MTPDPARTALRELLEEHLRFSDFGTLQVNYCWFCEQDINGMDGAKQEHLPTCLGQRTRTAIDALPALADAEPPACICPLDDARRADRRHRRLSVSSAGHAALAQRQEN